MERSLSFDMFDGAASSSMHCSDGVASMGDSGASSPVMTPKRMNSCISFNGGASVYGAGPPVAVPPPPPVSSALTPPLSPGRASSPAQLAASYAAAVPLHDRLLECGAHALQSLVNRSALLAEQAAFEGAAAVAATGGADDVACGALRAARGADVFLGRWGQVVQALVLRGGSVGGAAHLGWLRRVVLARHMALLNDYCGSGRGRSVLPACSAEVCMEVVVEVMRLCRAADAYDPDTTHLMLQCCRYVTTLLRGAASSTSSHTLSAFLTHLLCDEATFLEWVVQMSKVALCTSTVAPPPPPPPPPPSHAAAAQHASSPTGWPPPPPPPPSNPFGAAAARGEHHGGAPAIVLLQFWQAAVEFMAEAAPAGELAGDEERAAAAAAAQQPPPSAAAAAVRRKKRVSPSSCESNALSSLAESAASQDCKGGRYARRSGGGAGSDDEDEDAAAAAAAAAAATAAESREQRQTRALQFVPRLDFLCCCFEGKLLTWLVAGTCFDHLEVKLAALRLILSLLSLDASPLLQSSLTQSTYLRAHYLSVVSLYYNPRLFDTPQHTLLCLLNVKCLALFSVLGGTTAQALLDRLGIADLLVAELSGEDSTAAAGGTCAEPARPEAESSVGTAATSFLEAATPLVATEVQSPSTSSSVSVKSSRRGGGRRAARRKKQREQLSSPEGGIGECGSSFCLSASASADSDEERALENTSAADLALLPPSRPIAARAAAAAAAAAAADGIDAIAPTTWSLQSKPIVGSTPTMSLLLSPLESDNFGSSSFSLVGGGSGVLRTRLSGPLATDARTTPAALSPASVSLPPRRGSGGTAAARASVVVPPLRLSAARSALYGVADAPLGDTLASLKNVPGGGCSPTPTSSVVPPSPAPSTAVSAASKPRVPLLALGKAPTALWGVKEPSISHDMASSCGGGSSSVLSQTAGTRRRVVGSVSVGALDVLDGLGIGEAGGGGDDDDDDDEFGGSTTASTPRRRPELLALSLPLSKAEAVEEELSRSMASAFDRSRNASQAPPPSSVAAADVFAGGCRPLQRCGELHAWVVATLLLLLVDNSRRGSMNRDLYAREARGLCCGGGGGANGASSDATTSAAAKRAPLFADAFKVLFTHLNAAEHEGVSRAALEVVTNLTVNVVAVGPSDGEDGGGRRRRYRASEQIAGVADKAVVLLKLLSRSLFDPDVWQHGDAAAETVGRGGFSAVTRCRLVAPDADDAAAGAPSFVMKTMSADTGRLLDVCSEVIILRTLQREERRVRTRRLRGGVGGGCGVGALGLADFGFDGTSFSLVLLRCAESLKAYRSRAPALPLRHVLDLYFRVLGCVRTLHGLGIIHYDLKCDNVLLTWEGAGGSALPTVVLCDYGESVFEEEAQRAGLRARGTECLRPPEVLLAHRRGDFDRRAFLNTSLTSIDVWALGCLLFELLTNSFLFCSDDFAGFFHHVTSRDCPVLQPLSVAMIRAALTEGEGGDDTETTAFVTDYIALHLHRDPKKRPSITALLHYGTGNPSKTSPAGPAAAAAAAQQQHQGSSARPTTLLQAVAAAPTPPPLSCDDCADAFSDEEGDRRDVFEDLFGTAAACLGGSAGGGGGGSASPCADDASDRPGADDDDEESGEPTVESAGGSGGSGFAGIRSAYFDRLLLDTCSSGYGGEGSTTSLQRFLAENGVGLVVDLGGCGCSGPCGLSEEADRPWGEAEVCRVFAAATTAGSSVAVAPMSTTTASTSALFSPRQRLSDEAAAAARYEESLQRAAAFIGASPPGRRVLVRGPSERTTTFFALLLTHTFGVAPHEVFQKLAFEPASALCPGGAGAGDYSLLPRVARLFRWLRNNASGGLGGIGGSGVFGSTSGSGGGGGGGGCRRGPLPAPQFASAGCYRCLCGRCVYSCLPAGSSAATQSSSSLGGDSTFGEGVAAWWGALGTCFQRLLHGGGPAAAAAGPLGLRTLLESQVQRVESYAQFVHGNLLGTAGRPNTMKSVVPPRSFDAADGHPFSDVLNDFPLHGAETSAVVHWCATCHFVTHVEVSSSEARAKLGSPLGSGTSSVRLFSPTSLSPLTHSPIPALKETSPKRAGVPHGVSSLYVSLALRCDGAPTAGLRPMTAPPPLVTTRSSCVPDYRPLFFHAS